MTALVCIALLVADPSSQPVAALPVVLQSIRADVLASHCADITCWERSALRLDSALVGALSGLGAMQTQINARDTEIGALQTQVTTQASALTSTAGTLKQDGAALEPKWWTHPTLWLSIGLVAGLALFAAVTAAWNGIEHALAR